MLCVVDASFVGSLFLPGEGGSGSLALAQRIGREGAAAPAIWQLEILNMLLVAQRKSRLTLAMRGQILDSLDAMPIALEPALSHSQRGDVLHLAEKHALTTYDASYLELAMRLGLGLATLDLDLRKAAKTEGLSLL